ncbi:MAG: Hpt domain-containing protein [Chloroflexota bacterium]|jgi:HPt (histidine-containing phosphotransfer) domain-containing protein
MKKQVNPKQNEQQHSAGNHNETNLITDSWPIDHAALIQLMGATIANQMLTYLPDYFEASTPQVQRLLSAADKLDSQKMWLAAHALRGSSANMGMTSLVTLCLAIEKYCESDCLQEAAARANQVHEEYSRIQQAYNLPPLTVGQ